MSASEIGAVYASGLAAVIDRSGVKRSRIAWELCIDQSTVLAWVTGKRRVPTRDLPLLAELLECSVDELIGIARNQEASDAAARSEPQVPAEMRESESKPQSDLQAIPHYRWPLQLGMDGTPMGPSQPRSYCTCGRRVR